MLPTPVATTPDGIVTIYKAHIKAKGYKSNSFFDYGERYVYTFPYNKYWLGEVKASVEARKFAKEILMAPPRDVNDPNYTQGWADWENIGVGWHGSVSCRNQYLMNHVWPDSPLFNRYYETAPSFEEKPLIHPDILARYNARAADLFGSQVWSHQVAAIQEIMHKRRKGLNATMGVGKTMTAFMILDQLQRMGLHRIWWVGELATIHEYKAQRRTWLPSFSHEVCVNYESLGGEVRRAWKAPNVVVFDESTKVKTSSTGMHKAALDLVEQMEWTHGDEVYVILLTGTPAPNGHQDWWGQCEIIRPGFIREGSVDAFCERYGCVSYDKKQGRPVWKMTTDPETGVSTKLWKPDQVAKLPSRLAPLWLTQQRGKDTPDISIPEKKIKVWHRDPSDEMLMAAKMAVDLSPTKIIALNKLRQLSDGFLYGKEIIQETTADGTPIFLPTGEPALKERQTVERMDTPKDELVRNALEEFAEYNRVIFYTAYKDSVDRIVDLCLNLGWGVIRVDGRGWHSFGDADASLECFQVGHPKLRQAYSAYSKYADMPIAWVGHPKAAGKGVTLTASPVIVNYSLTWSYEDYAQASDRIMRSTYRDTRIINFSHLPSDLMILNKLESKGETMQITMDEIRRCYGLD